MLFKISHGDSSRISTTATPLHPGWCWFTDDDGKFYIDSADEDGGNAKRTCINPDAVGAFVKNFTAGNWSGGKITIPASEHNQALTDGVVLSKIYMLSNGAYSDQCLAVMDTEVTVSADKSVVLSYSGTGYAGKVILYG